MIPSYELVVQVFQRYFLIFPIAAKTCISLEMSLFSDEILKEGYIIAKT